MNSVTAEVQKLSERPYCRMMKAASRFLSHEGQTPFDWISLPFLKMVARTGADYE
jgi:hypothetical protein